MGYSTLRCPQGTKLGPWLFLILINDLSLSDSLNAQLWKYVDDITSSEVVPKGCDSDAQQIADKLAQWSSDDRVKLNNKKCKKLRISFARNQPELQPIVVNGSQHKTSWYHNITSDLSWKDHIGKVLKKAPKCLFSYIQHALDLFYRTLYQFFYYALPKYLQNDLERVQKRAFSITFPGLAYNKALEVAGIQTISDYNESICDKTFKYIS